MRILITFTRTRAIVWWLPMLFCSGLLAASETSMTATELLATFTGEDASRYQVHFHHSRETRIVSAEIYAVGNDSTTARYSGRDPEPWREVNNILRVTTADGFVGLSGVDTYYEGEFSHAHLDELQAVMGDVVALQTLDPFVVSAALKDRHPSLSDEVRASIDIALWDLGAKRAGIPLHEILGAKRHSIAAYASLPVYETVSEHIAAVRHYSGLGYTLFKYHVFGEIEKDLALVEQTQQAFLDTPFQFTIDLEGVYDVEDALRLGRKMDEGMFLWLEAPVPDDRLSDYRDLKQALDVQIIPAGYTDYSANFIQQGIDQEAWDAGRFDLTVVGGISPALQLLTIANEADLPIDIQSWGHTLAQAANLHLMLANERTPYFEASMPKEAFEFGMVNGDLLDQGRMTAPPGPGLGISVNWDQLATADFYAEVELEFSAEAAP